MALFEVENGRLVAAQFGHPVQWPIGEDVLDSVRNQVLEIVSRPLFPITWRDTSHHPDAAGTPRLTALDATGQVVCVEVTSHLDSDLLIASLSRLSDSAALSWTDLAREYAGGVEAFRTGWLRFRDSMPPTISAGPRLILVVGSIDDQVRPALDVLASSGVEVHELSMRALSSGRIFLDVQTVGPRLYGHVPHVLVSDAQSQATIGPAPSADNGLYARGETSWDPSEGDEDYLRADFDDATAQEDPETGAISIIAPHLPSRSERRHARHAQQRRDDTSEAVSVSADDEALELVAHMVGEQIALVLDTELATDTQVSEERAHLTEQGVIVVAEAEFSDPTDALASLGLSGIDGWHAWHIDNAEGPTLAEALAEIRAVR